MDGFSYAQQDNPAQGGADRGRVLVGGYGIGRNQLGRRVLRGLRQVALDRLAVGLGGNDQGNKGDSRSQAKHTV